LADFALGSNVPAEGVLQNYIRVSVATIAEAALIIRAMPAKPKVQRTGLVMLRVS
jgi:hypothetical protein